MAAQPHVLVVEDDLDCREMIQDIFEEAEIAVTPVASAEQALTVAASGCDVVLTDISLGAGRDGAWLLAELRRRALAMPVIAITGHSERLGELSRLGFAAVVIKPLVVDDLVGIVREVLRT